MYARFASDATGFFVFFGRKTKFFGQNLTSSAANNALSPFSTSGDGVRFL